MKKFKVSLEGPYDFDLYKDFGFKTDPRILIETSDKKRMFPLLDQVKEFKAINYIVGDLGNDYLNQDPIPLSTIDQSHFDQIVNMYNNSNYQLPVTKEEQKAANVTLEDLAKGLTYLDAKKPLEKMYIAWLNHPSNSNKDIMHNVSGDKILNLFNIQRFTIKEDDKVISELFSTHDGSPEYKEDGSLRDIAYMSVALDKDAIAKIKNYNNRNHTDVSIKNLIDSGKIPDLNTNGKLDLSDKNIISLDGLQNIENKENIMVLNLDDNKITDIKENALAELSVLQVLWLAGNKITVIKENAFTRLNALIILDLRDNKITDIKRMLLPVE